MAKWFRFGRCRAQSSHNDKYNHQYLHQRPPEDGATKQSYCLNPHLRETTLLVNSNWERPSVGWFIFSPLSPFYSVYNFLFSTLFIQCTAKVDCQMKFHHFSTILAPCSVSSFHVRLFTEGPYTDCLYVFDLTIYIQHNLWLLPVNYKNHVFRLIRI